PPHDYCAHRTAMMPKRRRTRAQDRAHRIATERRQNRTARTTQPTAPTGCTIDIGPAPPDTNRDPPPF
ncbi:hypothetical protein H7H53_02075, partial [Mycobacterium lacus]|nr:hypothetical protein [Mycobacterium lacus]